MTGAASSLSLAAVAAAALAGTSLSALAQDDVVNVYSARHYDTDVALYDEFTDATGITVNLIEADADELIERIAREGENSPADVFITVDAGRLWRAVQADILEPLHSDVLEAAVPPEFRHPDGYWFGMSKRARIIFYNHDTVDDPSRISTYESLADPDLGYTLCMRSSDNIYNQSLLASLIAADGEEAATEWAAGVVANMARDPEGGDRQQLEGAANGECDVAVSNHYYFTRYVADDDPESQAVVAALTPIFPNQDGRGTHINVSGAGVVKGAPHHDAAVAFLEYLVSPSAQAYFAAGNFEFPISQGAALAPEVEQVLSMAGVGPDFKHDTLNLSVLGENNPEAVMIFDRVGWK